MLIRYRQPDMYTRTVYWIEHLTESGLSYGLGCVNNNNHNMNTIEIKVKEGAVRVNAAFYKKKTEDIVLGYLDLHSKYAEILDAGTNEGDEPRIMLIAEEYTTNIDESKVGVATVVSLPGYVGWDFFMVQDPARYTLLFVLLKKTDMIEQ